MFEGAYFGAQLEGWQDASWLFLATSSPEMPKSDEIAAEAFKPGVARELSFGWEGLAHTNSTASGSWGRLWCFGA